jgi:hypothetical protein
MPIHNTISKQDRVKIINQDSANVNKTGIVEDITPSKKDKPEKFKVIIEDTLTCYWQELKDLQKINFKYHEGDAIIINNPDDWWHNERGIIAGFWFIGCQQYWIQLESGARYLAKEKNVKASVQSKVLELLC